MELHDAFECVLMRASEVCLDPVKAKPGSTAYMEAEYEQMALNMVEQYYREHILPKDKDHS